MRTAGSFREVEEFDRQDMARLSLEERVSAVEQLRRISFGEDRAQSRLDRVLVVTDLETVKRASGRDKDLRDVAILEAIAPLLGSKKRRWTKKSRHATERLSYPDRTPEAEHACPRTAD